jgi:hypothetical protein
LIVEMMECSDTDDSAVQSSLPVRRREKNAGGEEEWEVQAVDEEG